MQQSCYTATERYSQDPKYYCPSCEKVYRWKTALTRHLRYECGKKPYMQCPYCSYITNRKTSVQKHISRKHKDMPNIL